MVFFRWGLHTSHPEPSKPLPPLLRDCKEWFTNAKRQCTQEYDVKSDLKHLLWYHLSHCKVMSMTLKKLGKTKIHSNCHWDLRGFWPTDTTAFKGPWYLAQTGYWWWKLLYLPYSETVQRGNTASVLGTIGHWHLFFSIYLFIFTFLELYFYKSFFLLHLFLSLFFFGIQLIVVTEIFWTSLIDTHLHHRDQIAIILCTVDVG